MADAEPPTLPIRNARAAAATPGGGGRSPKKGGPSTRHRDSHRAKGGRKAWADFTPTPWLDYSPTPWGGMAGFAPYGALTGKETGSNHRHSESASTWPSTPTPTAKSWGATPTPSSAGSLQQHFGLVPPMGMLPPAYAAMAHMAGVTAAAAGAAAAAAAAAHGAFQGVGSPGQSDDFETSPWALANAGLHLPMGPPMGPPSAGSALHGTGKCKPCAWFWKQTGCQSGGECSYCHLCPEGELKNRKKVKVAAMRMGALQPANTAERNGARTLKLTSLV